METMICTIYSHQIDFELIVNELKAQIPNGKMKFETQDEFKIVYVTVKNGFLKPAKTMKVAFRQRINPSYQLLADNNCPFNVNLRGMYGLVDSLESRNEKVKELMLHKIVTLNSEFSILVDPELIREFHLFIVAISKKMQAILFVQPDNAIGKTRGQHFLDENLELIIDSYGNCDIEDLKIEINAAYFDNNQESFTADQQERKAKSQQIIENRHIKVNQNLPFIESEKDVIIRSPREIAERLVILATTNLVAFNNFTGEEALEYLTRHELTDKLTANEMDFLNNPTSTKKSHETWKCECIWILFWALKVVDNVEFPDRMCNLNEIPAEDYPIEIGKDPRDFIEKISESRSKSEILDLNDLYYRLNWACVDARIKGEGFSGIIPGVVHERHYTLNWLINYLDQEWDDVTCDT